MVAFGHVRIISRPGAGDGGTLRLIPAMQAGITNELWTMDRLYDEVMA